MRSLAAIALYIACLSAQVHAQAAYPSTAVRLVVPFSAGSQTDILARAYGDELLKRWKQPVVVENRPGLAGTASVVRAPADGLTILLVSNGHAMIQSLNRNINFDPLKDFAPVARVATIPGILVVPPEGGSQSLKDLIERAKAAPGGLNYASAGLGSASSIGAELLKTAAGIDLVHVPHRGLPEAHTAIMRGDAALFMTFFSAGGDLIQSGKMRAIAVTTAKRTPVLPDVPTMQEAGLPGYSYDPWFGLLVPAGTPKEVVDKIAADVGAVAREAAFAQRFSKLGVEVTTSTPAAFAATIRSDTERFIRIFGKADERP
ncbi:MAG: tripartite tricarboxylate transporter substrate binding protein [Hyphomicrobiales bacterium]|nr:tripartite tricarboxylate transporter substrate binding protein [Hyphomicrobiales bacterium]